MHGETMKFVNAQHVLVFYPLV